MRSNINYIAWAFLCTILIGAASPLQAASSNSIAIEAQDLTGLRGLRPVSGGIPIAEGEAPEGTTFTLLDENGAPVPCQTSTLGVWKDKSVKWTLLNFQADPPPNGMSQYQLVWGKENPQANPKIPVEVETGAIPILRTGALTIRPIETGVLRIAERLDIAFTLDRANGVVESIEVEEEGSIRSTLRLKGSFQTNEGARIVSFQMIVSIYAGLSKIFLEPLILIDPEEEIIQYIHDLSLRFKILHPLQSAKIGGDTEWHGGAESNVRLFQIDDRQYEIEGTTLKGEKAPGWAEITDEQGTMAFAIRDFWQEWPKSIAVKDNQLAIGLFPSFEAGAFDHMEPWYKYDYLFKDNTYRLRTGQARRWRIWIDLEGNGAALVKHANAPLVPSTDPKQAIAAGVWGWIAPAGSPGMDEYDRWAENLFFNGYCHSIKEQRDYGAMNWGDWFGERRVNWGNHEYDTPKHILVQFARTGDPRYFHMGDTAARHTSEVDVVHFINEDLRRYFNESSDYPARPGIVHQHMVGHVGGFHSMEQMKELYLSFNVGNTDNPYICWSPFNLGHIWTQGMVYQYFLTGDPWVKETIQKIGDNLRPPELGRGIP